MHGHRELGIRVCIAFLADLGVYVQAAVVKSTTGQGTWLWAGKANPARRHHSSISTAAEGGALTRGDAAAQPAPLKPGSKRGSGVKFSPEEHGLKAWVDYVPSLSSGSSRTGSLTSASDHSANLDSFSCMDHVCSVLALSLPLVCV